MTTPEDEPLADAFQRKLIQHAHFVTTGKGMALVLNHERFHHLIGEQLFLERAHIEDCHFSFSNLARTSFRGASLTKTRFTRCNLAGCDFRGASLRHVRVVDSEAQGAQFGGIFSRDLPRVPLSLQSDPDQNLHGWAVTDFSGCDFSGSDLTGAGFRGAMVRGANFTGANLENADFSDADLSDACLSHVRLSGAKFERTALEGAGFSLDDETRAKFGDNKAFSDFEAESQGIGTLIDDHQIWVESKGRSGAQASFKGRRLMGIDLGGRMLGALDASNARILGVNFDRAVLASADLRSSRIEFSSFCGADLRGIGLANALLINCNFQGANFGGLAMAEGGTVATDWAGTIFVRCDFTGAAIQGDASKLASFRDCAGL
jgi:uncharacterized protein YjbI with pentapeptide repeats